MTQVRRFGVRGSGGLAGAAAGAVLLVGTLAAPATAGAAVPTTTVPAAGVPTAAAPAPAATARTTGAGRAAGDVVDPLARYYAQKLAWRSCDPFTQCSSMLVPLSYEKPSLGSVRIALARQRATGPGTRLGTLVVNPGGPGGSGVDLASVWDYVASEGLRARYDTVGFDPRGVARSNPVQCFTDKQTDVFLSMDSSPDTAAETAAYARVSKTFNAACQERSKRIADHMDTRLVARDMDVLRAALGERKLTYLGYSYGTLIGLMYLDQFPTRVARMVLDGVVDPALNITGSTKGQSDGFGVALRRFATDCPRHADCPLPKDPKAGLARINAFLAGLDAKPLRTGTSRPLTQALGVTAVVGQMYDNVTQWPALRPALAAGFRGNGRPLLDLADATNGREPDGAYQDNGTAALYAVDCWDSPPPPGVPGTAALAAAWARTALVPEIARALAWGNLPCATWAGHAPQKPAPVVAKGSPPVLVVGNLYDPATPVQNARAVAKSLSRGVLLTTGADGHTAYGRDACASRLIDRYLLTGTPPRNGTFCR